MINNHKLKIGLDYHGLIDINAAYFSDFCNKAKQRGHYIYIITGGPKVLVEYNLRKNKIDHDFVYAISDHYQALGMMEYLPNGKIAIPKSIWNTAKAKFCSQNNISIHIDDDMQYLQWFSTPYGYYNKSENIIEMQSGTNFNINDDPQIALDKIEQILG